MLRVPSRSRRKSRSLCRAARLALFAFALPVFAASAPAAAQSTEAPALSAAQVRQKRASLIVVIDPMGRLREDLRERQEELESESGRGRETEILGEIREFSAKLSELERNFSEIAAGVDQNHELAVELPK